MDRQKELASLLDNFIARASCLNLQSDSSYNIRTTKTMFVDSLRFVFVYIGLYNKTYKNDDNYASHQQFSALSRAAGIPAEPSPRIAAKAVLVAWMASG